MDKEVFELARQIPTRYKVNKNETKIALRKAAEIQIGNNAGKKKLGFPVPVREWLRKEPYSSMVRTCFQSQAAKEFFHVEKLLKLLDEHVSGTRDRWREIWCVYMFLVWYEVYFEKE
nr:asparagine synthase-related protein [uncultured Blautia sp.]